ncbi:unnamed protein product [Pichia kudriavzevii]
MDTASKFELRSVTSSVNMNWVFLVDWVIIFFAATVFIFYFNRILGEVITLTATHILLRRKKIKFSIQSMKVNLLAGRLFMKNLSVITKDEIILVHTAVLTWKYWVQYVRKSQFYVQEENLNDELNSKLPSRFLLEVEGLEIFSFNKSGAYDNIESILKQESASKSSESYTKKSYKVSFDSSNISTNENANIRRRKSESSSNDTFNYTQNSVSDTTEEYTSEDSEVMDSTFLDFLPFEIVVHRGSFVLGNKNTPSLFVAYYSSMKGNVDATLPGCELDYYRTLYDFTVSNLKVDLRTNVTYESIDSLKRKMESFQKKKRAKLARMYKGFKGLIEKFEAIRQKRGKADVQDSSNTQNIEGATEEWHGLERYLSAFSTSDSQLNMELNTSESDKSKINGSEYAKHSNICDVEVFKINYYYDSQGLVPSNPISKTIKEDPDIGNNGPAPMFGCDITILGTTVNYGPWAEKQRGSLHQLMFPTLYRNTIPFQRLKPGMRRQYASFDMSIECGSDVIVRVPHREESKDISFLQSPNLNNRHFGWLDLKLGKGSITDISISFSPTVERGTENKINAVFLKPVISTSVNHDILFAADEHIFNGSIAFPLEWNGLCDWKFENISKGADIYLLREHITQISDLLGDFSSGEPTPYELFRPFIYRFNWKMYEYTFYLIINEGNIINNPLDGTINTYLTIKGSDLKLTTKIPLVHPYKKSNTIDYCLETSYFTLAIEHPASSTFSNFIQNNEIGESNNFKMQGSYTYFSLIDIDAVDTIIIHCTCDDTTLKAHGFVIKYFMSLKDNYFGDHTHFQNLLEFRESFGKQKEIINEGKQMKNETDLLFSFCVDNGCLVFPCHLYDCSSHLALHFDTLDIDLRNNNYYMDLQANFQDARGRYIPDCDELEIFANTKHKVDFVPELVIDELSIHSIRIFGLPPVEPTYYCRWNFDSSTIKIDAEPIFLDALSRTAKSFKFGYADLENSLSLMVTPVRDVLNLSFKCSNIYLKIKRQDYYFQVNIANILLRLSDQPTVFYNSLLELVIESIVAECYQNDVQLLKFNSSLEMKNFGQKKDAFEYMKEQALHLKKHDAPYHRTPFIIPEFAKDRKYFKEQDSITSSLYIPDPPLPLTNQSVEMLIGTFPLRIQEKLADFSTTLDENDEDDYDDYQKFSSNLEDFGVLKDLDPSCEYDSIPVRLPKLEVFVSPKIAPVFVDIVSNMTEFTIDCFLDALQTDFVDAFKFKQENKSLKMKFECPMITVKVSEHIESEAYCFLGVSDFVFAFSKSNVGSSESSNIYSIVKSINIDIVKNTSDVLRAYFFNILVKRSVGTKEILTFDLEDTALFVDPIHIPWLLDWAYSYQNDIQLAIKNWNQYQKDKRLANVELLYDLSRAGIDYNIIHDPPCITKPSYITGFSKNHIRMDGNWMIIPRLRHVLKNLPGEWISLKDEIFKNKTWEAPRDAESEVGVIFSNWRVWDNHKKDDNFIFKKVFNIEQATTKNLLSTYKIALKTIKLTINPFANAVIVENIFMLINEGELSQEIKTMALPLLDKPIEKSLDINIKISFLRTNFTKISRLLPRLYPLAQNLKQSISAFNSETEESDSDYANSDLGSTDSLHGIPRYEEVAPVLITANFTLDEYTHAFGIDKSKVVFYGQNTTLTSSIVRAEEMMSCTINLKNDYIGSEFNIDTIPIFDLRCYMHTSTLVNTGSFRRGNTVLYLTNQKIKADFLPDSKQIVSAMKVLFKDELSPIYHVVGVFKNSKKAESDSAIPQKRLSVIEWLKEDFFQTLDFQLSASMKTSTVIFHVELISPFFTNLQIIDPKFSFKLSKFGFILEYYMPSSKWSIGSQVGNYVYNYFTVTIDKMKTMLASHYQNKSNQVLSKIVGGFLRINFAQNDLIQMIQKFQGDFDIARSNFELLKISIEQMTHMLQTTNKEECSISAPQKSSFDIEDIFRLVHVTFDFTFGNVSSLLNINENKIHLDWAKPTIFIKTYANKLKKFSPHGRVTFPHFRLSVGLNGVQGITTFLDINTLVEVKTPIDRGNRLPKLEVKSDYCRVILNPSIVEELIDIVTDISSLWKPSASRLDSKVQHSDFEDKFEAIFSFFSINIVTNNFCVGWLFEESVLECHPNVIAPGIILGFENASISCAKDAGKLNMSGMYLSTAHGYMSSTFYSKTSEKESNNRAFFPSFNLVYIVDSRDNSFKLRSQVNGEKVDFKFQTDIFSITGPLKYSILSINEKLSLAKGKMNLNVNEKHGDNDHKDLLITRKNKQYTFEFVFEFAGASFFIYNPNIGINDTIPILSLHSPKLSSVFRYTHNHLKSKRHSILLSALVSETNNKISCLCVPVLHDLKQSFKDMMSKGNTSIQETTKKDSSSIDVVGLTKNLDINFSLTIKPQYLSLTCEPRANIEAEVVLGAIHLIAKTDQEILSLVLHVQFLKSELKHAYSKVTSGSVQMEGLSVNSSISRISENQKFSTVISLKSADAFVNIPQRQDLDLFRDFWLPNNSTGSIFVPKGKSESNKKTFTSILREVSSTAAFPWVLTLFISKISARVELGSSLGTLNVEIFNVDALTVKSIDWDSNFRLQFEVVKIQATGRLDGILMANKVRMTSSVVWKRDNEVLSIPLVLLSIGIHSLETRISLDYHPFFILEVLNVGVTSFNQREPTSHDKLKLSLKLESLRVYMTALMASNFVDVYTIGLRIRQDTRLSYRQVLNDAKINLEKSESVNVPAPSETFFKMIQKLKTYLNVDIGMVRVQIYPSSLTDRQAMVVKLGHSQAYFYQNSVRSLVNHLELKISDITVSLSSYKKRPTIESLNNSNGIQEYIKTANKIVDDNIFVFPSVNISMKTLQGVNSNTVQYKYFCKFDGKVAIKWKIGSVYFIREMWYTHATTLSNRLTALRIYTSDEYTEDTEENYKQSTLEAVNLESKLKDVESDAKYTYVPQAPPEIETPQLKDLGNATPPMEWFGLHRDKFPNLTHQFIVIGLQKMIRGVEGKYSKVLK